MKQLIEMLSNDPQIICILLFWPLLLWVLKVISQKVYFKYQEK